jgi:hypothetical protein
MNLLGSFVSMFSPSDSGVRRVEPAETAQLVRDKKAVLVDVREPAEWAGGVAQKAVDWARQRRCFGLQTGRPARCQPRRLPPLAAL